MEPTVRLSQDQIAFFHENGYLTLDAITTPDEVEWMRAIYDGLFERRAGREEGNQFDLAGTDEDDAEASLPQILGPSEYAPELKNGLFRVNAEAITKQLLGEKSSLTGEHMIFKPARIGAETPWHQDEAYWDPGLDYSSISIWIPLQDATVENGCMQFVSGSHRGDILTHHSIGHDPRVHGLEAEGMDLGNVVACPLPAGGATIHHCRTLHYTGANRTDVPRRAYILIGAAPAKPSTEGRRFPWNEIKATARQERAARSATA